MSSSATPLLTLLASLLAPLFLEATGHDGPLAYAAALETINEYRAHTQADLLLVAQIIALSFAAIGAAVQSMDPDIPPGTALRLQTKATSLSRGADRARKTLEQSRQQPAPDVSTQPQSETAALAIQPQPVPLAAPLAAPSPLVTRSAESPVTAAAAHPAAPPGHDPIKANWIAAFTEAAEDIVLSLPSLPPNERRAASIQAGALAQAARDLRDGVPYQAI